MDFFSSLPEGCISDILSLASPRDACRSSAISRGFKTAADSDIVWERFLPSDYPEIMSRSVSPVAFSTKKQLFFLLSDSPILLDGGKVSFALDKESGKKCYMLGARSLAITWGSSPEYWEWRSLPQSRFPEVAQLLAVCWLQIKGKLETRMLSPNTTYVAYLLFRIARRNHGLESLPAKASVRFVGESSGDGDEDDDDHGSNVLLKIRTHRPARGPENGRLPRERKDGWMEIELGEFFNEQGNNGEVEMELRETKQGNWKSGLIVEGIELRPKIDA